MDVLRKGVGEEIFMAKIMLLAAILAVFFGKDHQLGAHAQR